MFCSATLLQSVKRLNHITIKLHATTEYKYVLIYKITDNLRVYLRANLKAPFSEIVLRLLLRLKFPIRQNHTSVSIIFYMKTSSNGNPLVSLIICYYCASIPFLTANKCISIIQVIVKLYSLQQQ